MHQGTKLKLDKKLQYIQFCMCHAHTAEPQSSVTFKITGIPQGFLRGKGKIDYTFYQKSIKMKRRNMKWLRNKYDNRKSEIQLQTSKI